MAPSIDDENGVETPVIAAEIVPAGFGGGLTNLDPVGGRSYSDPVGAYLASLSTKKSRSTAIESLRRVATIIGLAPGDPERWRHIPWRRLRHAETNMVRSACVAKYKPATARLTLTVLKGVMHEAYRCGWIDAEHYEGAVDLDPVKGKSARPGRDMKLQEHRTLLEHLDALPRFYGSMVKALFALGLEGGLRREELATLRVDGVGDGVLRFVGKGRKAAEQMILPATQETLSAWLEQRRKCPFQVATVFVQANRTKAWDLALTPKQVWEIVRAEVEAAGLKKLTPHDLRRTFITRAAAMGPLQVVKELARHEDMSTTERYIRDQEEQAQALLKKMGTMAGAGDESKTGRTLEDDDE